MKVAAIDIGSNAIRFAVAQVGGAGDFELETRQRVSLRLGAEAFSTGIFSKKTIHKAGKVFADFRKQMDALDVSIYRAVATSAFRCAKNSDEFAKEVKKRSGIVIEEISGHLEASTILNAVKSSIDISERDYLLMDIGGGSMELSLLSKGEVLASMSFPLGTVRLLEAIKNSEKPEKKLLKLLAQAEPSVHQFLHDQIDSKKSLRLIGTGGNFRRMLKIRNRIWKDKRPFLAPEELPLLYAQLEGISIEKRVEKFGLRSDRADVIIPALKLVMMVIHDLPVKKIYAPDVGLIHGVLSALSEEI